MGDPQGLGLGLQNREQQNQGVGVGVEGQLIQQGDTLGEVGHLVEYA